MSSIFILKMLHTYQTCFFSSHVELDFTYKSPILTKKNFLPRVNLKAFWLFQANLLLNQIPSFFLWENSSKTINLALFLNYYLEFHSSSIIFHENRTVIFHVKLLVLSLIGFSIEPLFLTYTP